MIGMLVYSKAGHDAGNVFMVIREEGDSVYLCDGGLRPLEKPKKKKKKHVQPILNGYERTVGENLKKELPVRNEEIKRTIKLFVRKEVKSDV